VQKDSNGSTGWLRRWRSSGDPGALQASDIQVKAAPVQSKSHRSWVTVSVHNTTGGELHDVPVVFYDGDPADGGKSFDFQRIAYIAPDDTYALSIPFHPQISGSHDVYVRVGYKGASAAPVSTTVTIP
jgi:hypothetical protein